MIKPHSIRSHVLDHGFVELIDIMGDDQAIVDAARVSIAGEKVKPVQDNRALIRYLYRNRHTTPFEMVELKFRAKMPIFVARQWVRHRTASINEMSARYSEMPEQFYVPEVGDINLQAKNNKQGRIEEALDEALGHQQDFQREAKDSFSSYKGRLQEGMARELARINLPLSTYTTWIWKTNLHNLFNFLALRTHPHAQYEIRVYAEAMSEMVKEMVPLAWEAFYDFRTMSLSLTRQEVTALTFLIHTHGGKALDVNDPEVVKWFEILPTKRERMEFIEKLEELGWLVEGV